jgi:hypothetical protein
MKGWALEKACARSNGEDIKQNATRLGDWVGGCAGGQGGTDITVPFTTV